MIGLLALVILVLLAWVLLVGLGDTLVGGGGASARPDPNYTPPAHLLTRWDVFVFGTAAVLIGLFVAARVLGL